MRRNDSRVSSTGFSADGGTVGGISAETLVKRPFIHPEQYYIKLIVRSEY